MWLRSHRRNLVVWSSAAPAGRPDRPRSTRLTRARRFRRRIRIGVLLTVLGLMRLAAAVRTPLGCVLSGGGLIAVGIVVRTGAGGLVFFPGALILLHGLFSPANPDAVSYRRRELERELATYTTQAQRRDLEAILDQYPDDITYELRDILAGQPVARTRPGRA